MAEISVIVPVYKVEPYLRRCVDSILAQTFTDFELILVDDGSPDNCGAICDEYAQIDSRVHVLHRENQGVAAARNAGIDWVFANSDSKYIGFVDSDDWVHPRFLELLYYGIQRLHVNISQCRFIKTDGTLEVPDVGETIKLIGPTEHFMDYYSGAVWNKLFSRECWRSRRFPVGQVYGEDAAVWYRILLEKKKIALIDEILYYYFQRIDSVMQADWKPEYFARMDTWDEQIAYINKHGEADLIQAAIIWYCRIWQHEYVAIEQSAALSDTDKRKYKALMWQKLRRLMICNHKEMKQTANYTWFKENAFPRLNWCYWTVRGIHNKVKRALKRIK